MADGKVVISTRMDNGQFVKDLNGIRSSVADMTKAVGASFQVASDAGVKSATTIRQGFEKTEQTLRHNVTELERVRAQMAEIEQADPADATSKAFESATAKVEDTEYAIGHLYEQIEALKQSLHEELVPDGVTGDAARNLVEGALESNKEYQKLNTTLDSLEQKLVQQKLAVDAAKEAAVVSAGTQGSEYQKLIAEQTKFENKIEDGSLKLQHFQEKMSLVAGAAEDVAEHTNIAGNAVNGLKGFLQKAIGVLGKFVSGARKSAKQTNVLSTAFGRLGTMLKLMLVRRAMMAVIKAVRDGMRDLAQVSAPFNTAMSQMKTQSLTMRNALTSAFAPALQALIPIFTTVTNAVITCMNAVAAFTARIFGNAGTFYKAKTAAVDYASSVAGAGGAAKKATGQLAAFDELNVLQDPDSSGGGAGGPSPFEMWEEVEIPDWVDMLGDPAALGAKIAGFLNDAIAGVDWGGIGTTMGQGINVAFSFVYSFIKSFNWGALSAGVATSLSAMIATVDWDTVGRTFASYWTIIVDLLYGFVTTFDWPGFGNAISTAINAWFDEIDWAKAGQTITESLTGLLTTISTALSGVDWRQIGQDIQDFLTNIDWTAIIAALATVIGYAISGIVLLLWVFIEDAVTGIVEYWSNAFKEAGENIILGLLLGIGMAIANIFVWLVSNVFEPFCKAFCDLFGINSPSTVMAEFGVFLIMGLINGIRSIIDTVATLFINLWNTIQNNASAAWEGIKSVWGGVSAWFNDTIVKPIANFFGGLWTGIETGASLLGSIIKDEVITPLVSAFKGMYNSVARIIEGLVNGFIGVINGFIGGINTAISAINAIPGVNLPNLTTLPQVSIPRLAQGAVIPANREFIAELGDQKHGRNLEAPEDLIRQIVREEAGAGDQPINIHVVAEVDGRVLFEINKQETRRRGPQLVKGGAY